MTLANLRAEGFHVDDNELFGALKAARRLVEQRGLRPMLLLTQEALAEFDGVSTVEPNAVVVGTAPGHFHYDRLNEAMRALLDDERSELIACNKGRYFRDGDGLLSLQAGAFVATLEFATDKEAVVVGKPSLDFFLTAVRDAAAASEGASTSPAPSPEHLSRCVMIGDDAKDDVLGAMQVGMQAILVRTGKYRAGDEDKFPTGQRPLFVADDIAQAADFLSAKGYLSG